MTGVSLEFIDSGANAGLREKWTDLKGKYAAVLLSNEVKFDKKLGPMLDKRAKLIKTLRGYESKVAVGLVKAQLISLKSNTNSFEAAVTTYLDRVDNLGNP